MAFSDYFEAEVLGWIKGEAFASAPTNLYCSLHSAAPDEDGSPTNELAATGGYARVAIPVADWSAISQVTDVATISNSAAVVFPTATANWSAAVTHFGLFDASTAGNLILAAALDTPRTILDGDVDPTFAAGALEITLS